MVEAFQFTGEIISPWPLWFVRSDKVKHYTDGRTEIVTLEGVMQVTPGDWIIKGVEGEIYPCKAHIFDATYEPVEAVG